MTDFLADLGSTGHIIVGFVLVVAVGLAWGVWHGKHGGCGDDSRAGSEEGVP